MRAWGWAARVRAGVVGLALLLTLFGAFPVQAVSPCWSGGVWAEPWRTFSPPDLQVSVLGCITADPTSAASCVYAKLGWEGPVSCDIYAPDAPNYACYGGGGNAQTLECPEGHQCIQHIVNKIEGYEDPNCKYCPLGRDEYGNCVTTAPTKLDPTLCSSKDTSGTGMCVATAHIMQVSLNLNDTPIGYQPPVGPGVFFKLTYNQQESSQPGTFNFSNVGPKWSHSFLTYIEDDTANPGQNVKRIVDGGGAIVQTGYSGGSFAREKQSLAQLVRTPATGTATSYTLSFPDGSSQTYGYTATGIPHRLFLSAITDAQGKSLTLAYDASNRLTTITDATGKVTTFSYNDPNPLLMTDITDPFGRTANLAYDASNRLTDITDVLGITSTMTYDATDLGFITQLATPYGASSFATGADDITEQRWLQLTDAMGGSEWLAFIPNAPGVAATPANVPTGITTASTGYERANSFYWNPHVMALYGNADMTKAKRWHWLTDAQGQAAPILAMAKPALDNPTYLNYPGQAQPDTVGTHAVPSAIGRKTDATTSQLTQIATNGLGKPTSVTDPVGRVSTVAYDATGVDPLTVQQKTSATAYTTVASLGSYSAHLPTSTTDAAGKVWRYAYNAAGQMIYATNPLNQTRFWEYDASGRMTRATVPVAVAYASVVYGTTNVSAATAQSYNYTAACSSVTAPANTNLPISVTDSQGYVLCYQYDALDRVTKVKYPDGTTEQYSYAFPAGWTANGVNYGGTQSLDVWQVTDRQGRVTSYTYDRNRRLTAKTEPVTVAGVATTRTTSYSYYADGTLKELTDANGNVTHWDIDIQSRPTAKTYAYGTANAKTETYTYDLAGRLKTVTDAKGQVLTLVRNKDDSIASYAYTNATIATPGASFTYDPWYPRRTGMTDQFGTTTWSYIPVGTNGALGQQTENGPFNNDSMTLAYDAAGRVNSRTVSGTTAETFGFDTLGRMTSHVTQLGSFTYGYLGNSGQVSTRTIGGITTTWGYDTNANDRRLLTISTTGAVARNFTYASNAYQITGITDTPAATHPWLGQSWSFSYDGSDRLLTGSGTIAGNSTFQYDKLDNATSFAGAVASYNGLNQITAWNAATHTYDNNGNLTGDGTRTYTYDAADRLKTVTQGGTTTTFAYDGLGRRLKQTVGTTETRYLWCGAAICQQRSNTDTVQKRFFAEGEYVLTGTKKYLYLTDHLGSVRDLVDITGTPTLVGSFDYTPYGAVARSWGTVTPGYTYAGLFAHPQTGLLLSTTRAYEPTKGRWLNRDSIPGWDYPYVSANPVNLFDPQGTFGIPAFMIQAAFGGAAAGAAGAAGTIWALPGRPATAIPDLKLPHIPGIWDKDVRDGLVLGFTVVGGGIKNYVCSQKEEDDPTKTPDPQDLEGKTPEEVKKLLEGKGWTGQPTADGKGVRYPNPYKPNEQVRVMPGTPQSSIPIKAGGTNIIISAGGKKIRVPGVGNSELK